MTTQSMVSHARRSLCFTLIAGAALFAGCEFDLDMGFSSGTGPTYPPTPYTGPHFSDVSFASVNDGVAVSDRGWIAWTSTGGRTWTALQPSAVPHYALLKSVSCPTPGLVWATGLDCGIVHSADGGATWQVQVADSYDSTFWAVHFANGSAGWAVGVSHVLGGIIIATADGGVTWDTQFVESLQGLRDVFFLGDKAGWAVGYYGLILRTRDGGETWEHQNSNLSEALIQVDFVDSHTGWILSDHGSVLYTEDGGTTWVPRDPIFDGESFPLHAFDFTTYQEGWMVGSGAYVGHSTDAGVHCSSVPLAANSAYFFNAVCFADTDHGWLVGTEKTIFCTTNGGISWLRQTLTF